MNKKKTCLFLIAYGILYLIAKSISIVKKVYFVYYLDILCYLILFILSFIVFGFPKDKKLYKKLCIRYVIIAFLGYALITYSLGLFTGFLKNGYSTTFSMTLKNSLPIVSLVILRELERNIICNKSIKGISPLVIYCIFNIMVGLCNNIFIHKYNSFYQIFVVTSTYVLPLIANEMLSSYLTYNTSFVPALIYNAILSVLPFVLPIIPDLGDYLNSCLNLILPYYIFINFKNVIVKKERKATNFGKRSLLIIAVPLSLFLIVIALLVSGIFNYKMIAIASNSMFPVYERGDAIIYEKVKPEDIEKDDILVFTYNNTIITHRVRRIVESNGALKFETKGDNNDLPDANLVEKSEVLGRVRYIVKFIGYPTVWINGKF